MHDFCWAGSAAQLQPRTSDMESSRCGAQRKQQLRRLQHQPDRRQRPPGVVVQVCLGAGTVQAQVRPRPYQLATPYKAVVWGAIMVDRGNCILHAAQSGCWDVVRARGKVVRVTLTTGPGIEDEDLRL